MITYHFQNDEETFDAMTELTLRVNPTKRAMVAERILCLTFLFTVKSRRKETMKRETLKEIKDYLNKKGTWIFSENGVKTESADGILKSIQKFLYGE